MAAIRKLTRKQSCAVRALESAIEHEPALRPVLVSDYAHSRLQVYDLRGLLQRRIIAISGHVDEPGSRSALRPLTIISPSGSDGLSPYGTEDTTGFAPGCVY